MNFNKFREFCRIIRIVLGAVLIVVGISIENWWLLLGIVPLIAGMINFCPVCTITKKCDINLN